MRFIQRDHSTEKEAFWPVVEAVENVAAQIYSPRPGLLYVPAKNIARGAHQEVELARQLEECALLATGEEGRSSIANGQFTALLAAHGQQIIPVEQTGRFLSPHPVDRLEAYPCPVSLTQMVETLKKLGVKTLGQMIDLGRANTTARFGPAGALAYSLASGEDPLTLTPVARNKPVGVTREFDPPLIDSAAAMFNALPLIEEFKQTLAARGQTCALLRIEAKSVGGGRHSRQWHIESPQHIEQRLRWQFDTWLNATGPLMSITLLCERSASPLQTDKQLWEEGGKTRTAAREGISRLQSLLGPEGVVRPVLCGGYDPRSRAHLLPWDTPEPQLPPDGPGLWQGAIGAPSPSTVLARPERVTIYDGEKQGRIHRTEHGGSAGPDTPVEVDTRGNLVGRPALLVRAAPPARYAITGHEGPWPVTGKWWQGQEPKFYLRLNLRQHAPVLVYLAEKQWWLDAIYD